MGKVWRFCDVVICLRRFVMIFWIQIIAILESFLVFSDRVKSLGVRKFVDFDGFFKKIELIVYM